jgi:hypothetical protein
MAMELANATMNGNDNNRDTLFMLGGLAMVVFGAGLILTNPFVRRYTSQLGAGGLLGAALPDVERYFRLRSM